MEGPLSLEARVPPENYPWWVKITMLGGRTRRAMQIYLVASIVLGAVLVGFGLWADRPFYLWLGLIGAPLSALAYFFTIRWIDRHGTWPT